jgi:hypothetical protein
MKFRGAGTCTSSPGCAHAKTNGQGTFPTQPHSWPALYWDSVLFRLLLSEANIARGRRLGDMQLRAGLLRGGLAREDEDLRKESRAAVA